MHKTELLIIGAGIIGVMTAKFLVDNGYKDITIIEKNYPGSGGTFRCATGIRASFTSEEHVELMKEAIDLWPKLAEQHNFQYRRDGYIWLISNEKDLEMFKKVVEFHHQHGVPTRIIDPDDIKEIVPTIRLGKIIAGVHDPLAGKADCFESLLKILQYLRDNGVKIYDHTSAEKIVVENGRAKGVETSRGFIEAEKILVAAGYGSKKILETVGIDIPMYNLPKHALITEAYKPLFKPLLIDWDTASYIVQVIHGGFLIGANIDEEPDKPALNRIEYLYLAAKIWTKFFPWLSEVRVLRYWTGYYVMTPDHHPVIGPSEEVENIYIATGFSGHGFMMSPVVGKIMAEYIIEGKTKNKIAERLSPARFKKGELIKEIAVFG